MNKTFYEFVNEELSMLSNKKLRDAIHDIVVNLGPKDVIDIEELSNVLLLDHRITISPSFLDSFFEDYMKSRKGEEVSDSLFSRQDSRWLGVREKEDTKEIRNNLYFLKPNLAKHKERLVREVAIEKLEKAYKDGMKDLDFNEEIIKKSLILQHPADSKKMMIEMYNVVNILMKYKNTYENCWKMMIRMANNMKLDKRRGYFQYAPQTVKDEYNATQKFNLELEKEKENPEPSKKVEGSEKTTSRTATNKSNLIEGEEVVVRNADTKENNRYKIFDVIVMTDTENIKGCGLKLEGSDIVARTKVEKSDGEIIYVYWKDISGAWYYSDSLPKVGSKESIIKNSTENNFFDNTKADLTKNNNLLQGEAVVVNHYGKGKKFKAGVVSNTVAVKDLIFKNKFSNFGSDQKVLYRTTVESNDKIIYIYWTNEMKCWFYSEDLPKYKETDKTEESTKKQSIVKYDSSTFGLDIEEGNIIKIWHEGGLVDAKVITKPRKMGAPMPPLSESEYDSFITVRIRNSASNSSAYHLKKKINKNGTIQGDYWVSFS